MKSWILIWTYSLSALLLYNTARVSFTYAYYELDPIGFIEELCENKDQPELECLGKCHLKKVSQSATNDNEPAQLINFDELVLFTETPFNYKINTNFLTQEKLNIFYINNYSFKLEIAVFHPPQV